MIELISALGVTGSLLAVSLYFLWKQTVENKVIAEKKDIMIQSLEKRLEQQNDQIKILSNRADVDSEQLLRNGSF